MKGVDNMGFKNKLNKMKSFLFDEEEEKEVVKTPKVIKEKKEERKPVKVIEEEYETKDNDDLYFEDVSETFTPDVTEVKSRSVKNENEFKFPEFNDDDFMVAKPKQKIEVEEVKSVKKDETRTLLYQGSKRKEETKKFKPSPIISPIYGLLDKEGNTVKKDDETYDSSYLDNSEPSLDMVRKKAYGILDEELENTMKRLSNKTIEEAEKEMEKEEELSRIKQKNKKEESKVIEIPKKISYEEENDDDDDMILPNLKFNEIDVDKELKEGKTGAMKKITPKDYDEEEDEEDTKEQDLFNLIDTMYSKEGKDK